MLYIFTSAAGPRVTYTGAVGEEILKAAGRNPGPRGVIPVVDIGEVRARLAAAVAREAAANAALEAPDPQAPPAVVASDDDDPAPVSLARRLVPFLELLERAEAAGKDVTWGI